MDLVTVEGWGKGKYTHEVGVRWTNGREGRGRKNTLFQLPHTPLSPPSALCPNSTNQTSVYNLKWRHRKPGLSNDPFQNNACNAD